MSDSSRWRTCCLHRLGDNVANYELISLETPAEVTFGRACTNNIVLDEAQSISRFHGVLRKDAGNWTVTDLKSCNGVVVNGRAIPPSVEFAIQDKDIIEFGKDASSCEPAVYRFQFFKAAKVKVKQMDGSCLNMNSQIAEKCVLPPVKKVRENGPFPGSPSLVRQRLAEQERLLREEMQRKEQDMQKRFAEMQSILLKKEAEKENMLQQMIEYKQKMEVELLHQREHESQLAKDKEEALKKIKESEMTAEQRILELETILATNLHKSTEEVEQLRLEKEQIEAALRKGKENMEIEIQKKDEVLLRLAQEKEGALEGLKKQLEDKQQKEADMGAVVEEMRKEKENMEMLMQQQKDNHEQEKENLASEMQTKMDQELRDQELALRDEVVDQISQLIMEKDTIEINLKAEMKKAMENKDKELEGELLQKQKELAEAIAKKEEEHEALKAEIDKHKEIGAKESQQVKEKFENLMEQELVCPICNELFIKARSLGCSHTFCEYCIKKWMLRKAECPNCRSPIQSCVRSIVMDNYIEKTVEFLGKQQKQDRKKALASRKAEQDDFDKKEAEKTTKQPAAPAAALQATRPHTTGARYPNSGRNVFAVNAQENRSTNSGHSRPYHQAYTNPHRPYQYANAATAGYTRQPYRGFGYSPVNHKNGPGSNEGR